LIRLRARSPPSCLAPVVLVSPPAMVLRDTAN
jgi:hypothetical protein